MYMHCLWFSHPDYLCNGPANSGTSITFDLVIQTVMQWADNGRWMSLQSQIRRPFSSITVLSADIKWLWVTVKQQYYINSSGRIDVTVFQLCGSLGHPPYTVRPTISTAQKLEARQTVHLLWCRILKLLMPFSNSFYMSIILVIFLHYFWCGSMSKWV